MGTDITTYKAKLEEQARQAVAAEPPQSGQFFSTRGGILALGETILPGNQMAVIVIDSLRENTLYAAAFESADPQPPICYAYGRDAESMAPHITMSKHPEYFQPQHQDRVTGLYSCEGCPMNAWGSAEQGRGKACKNKRRLTLIPAGYYTSKPKSRDFDLHLITDLAHFETADAAFLSLPVTSVKDWATFVGQCSANFRVPPHGVVTRIYIEPDPASQYKVKFEILDVVPDDLIPVVIARNEAARAMPEKGYEPPDLEAKAQRAGALAGLRRPGA